MFFSAFNEVFVDLSPVLLPDFTGFIVVFLYRVSLGRSFVRFFVIAELKMKLVSLLISLFPGFYRV